MPTTTSGRWGGVAPNPHIPGRWGGVACVNGGICRRVVVVIVEPTLQTGIVQRAILIGDAMVFV